MTLALLFLIAVLLAVGLIREMSGADRWHQWLLKLLMGRPARHFRPNTPLFAGRRRGGSVCFVTGMSRVTCGCTNCRRGT